MAILEIEIGTSEQARLQRDAERVGVSVAEWARQRLFETPHPGREQETYLVHEYHAFVEAERRGPLSEAQAERRRQVQAELDELEAQDPLEQASDRRLQQTTGKLDEVLELLRRMPDKNPIRGNAGR